MGIVEIEHLHKRYGDVTAVADVSLTVEEGEIFGILGPNGAGKTTTVEIVAGLRRSDGGTVRVLGLDPARDGAELHARVGVQLQESALPDKLRVGEALELYASFYADPADPAELLGALGLDARRDARWAKLSGGEKQRLSIALALIGNPRLAILDELTTGLDPRARRDTWGLIEGVRGRGVTLILVTHFMEEAERLCDRVALIDAGRVVAVGSPATVAAAAEPEQRMRFRPSRAVADALLLALPAVRGVEHEGDRVVVRGTGPLIQDVLTELSRAGVVAGELHIEQAGLEDAFVALTGHGREAA